MAVAAVWAERLPDAGAAGVAAGVCAALVACARRGLSDRQARLELDGGLLHIDWRETDDHVIMTGPVALDYSGTLP